MRALTIIPLVCLLAGSLAGCSEPETVNHEQQNVRPARIMTIVNEGDETILEFSGRVDALQTVDVSFEVSGPLAELPIREGESLAKGALVAALDPTDFHLAVREAEVQLQLAAQDLNRKRQVLKENGIAKSQVEDARSSYELMKVRLSKARERLADSRISAPFEAYVSRRYVDRYANVSAGDNIARLHDLTRLKVVFSVPEERFATVGADRLLAAWAEFSFAPGERFELQFLESAGEADAIAQTYEVAFTMDKPERWNILPGMTATVNIQLKSTGDARTIVPASALVPGPDNAIYVWVYDDATSSVERKAVTTGAPEANGIPVLGGLVAGDRIVVTGASQLQAGMKVRPL